MDPLQNKCSDILVQQRDWNRLKVLAIEFGLYFKRKKERKKRLLFFMIKALPLALKDNIGKGGSVDQSSPNKAKPNFPLFLAVSFQL